VRWLTAALVIINLGFWMWQSWYSVPGGVVPAPRPRAEINASQLIPLDAQGVMIRPARSGGNKQVRELVDVTPPRLCYRIGPFARENAAIKARKQLVSVAISANPNESTEKKTIYRVYIPPLKSRSDAQNLQKRLAKSGFKDHVILADPKLKNAISLGVFTVQKNADKRLARLKKKKFNAKKEKITSTKNLYWLDVKTEQGLSPEFKETWGAKGVKVIDTRCDHHP